MNIKQSSVVSYKKPWSHTRSIKSGLDESCGVVHKFLTSILNTLGKFLKSFEHI